MSNFKDPLIVIIECKLCKKDHRVTISEKDLEKYHAGAMVQDAFPYLNPGERELFITAFCSKCYDSLFRSTDEMIPSKEGKDFRRE